jgi:hypothetical protein
MTLQKLIPLLLLLSHSIALVAADKVGDDPYEIRLRSRTFVPSPGIDPRLRQALNQGVYFPVHGIVQFFRIPSQIEYTNLLKAGVQLREYLGQTEYFAEFSRKTSFNSITNVVRWAGMLTAEDRTEKALWKGDIETWAKTPTGSIRVLATFYRELSPEEAQKSLAKYASQIRPFALGRNWAIEIPLEKVKPLAREPAVSWLQQGPNPGSQPLSVSPPDY